MLASTTAAKRLLNLEADGQPARTGRHHVEWRERAADDDPPSSVRVEYEQVQSVHGHRHPLVSPARSQRRHTVAMSFLRNLFGGRRAQKPASVPASPPLSQSA